MSLFRPVSNASQIRGLTTRHLEEAGKVEADNALELHRYKHGAYVRTQIAKYDICMVAEVNEAAATTEMEMVDRLLHRAGTSPVKVAIAARAAERTAYAIDSRIRRQFGEWW